MQFNLQTLLLVVLVVAASVAAFGPGGFVPALIIVALAVFLGWAKAKSVDTLPVAMVMALGLILLGLFSITTDRNSSGGRRYRCLNNLKQISLALHEYHNAHGRFPPACVPDADGKPMHSWRVLILPFMDQRPLYDRYDFSESWNGPNNSKLVDEMPLEYACPGDARAWPMMTSYVAVVGPRTAWPEGTGAKKGDIDDGADKTIMLVEVADSGINWMEPRDLSFEEARQGINRKPGLGISSRHETDRRFYRDSIGANAILADGSGRFLPEGLSPETLQALLTKDGGETVEVDARLDPKGPGTRRLNWGMCFALLVFAVSVALLSRRAWRSRKGSLTA